MDILTIVLTSLNRTRFMCFVINMYISFYFIKYRQNISPSLSTYVVLTNIERDEVCPPPHRAYYAAVVTTASPPAPFASVP